MELTKYEHACFTLEKDGKCIVIDPGSLTTDLSISENIIAVIITHNHEDHFNEEQIAQIISKNPTALVIGPGEVTSQLSGYETRTVHSGDSFAVEGFDLDFYGDNHAVIHPDVPVTQNVGVLIEDRIYYPGDSFTMPEKSVDTLALPVAAPWLKIDDVIEYMKSIGARFTFPTHDAILSPAGKHIVDSMLGHFAEAAETEYRRIDGETVDIE